MPNIPWKYFKTSDAADFKRKNTTRDKEEHLRRIKGTIHHREILIIICIYGLIQVQNT